MEKTSITKITVESIVKAPVEKVWNYWTAPEHITKWNSASDDWHLPHAENDLRVGGKFSARMEAKDGSVGFYFGGIYGEIKTHELIEYSLADGRKVVVRFTASGSETKVVEVFDAENSHPVDLQRGGWQAVLDNFKKYTEAN